MKIIYLFILLCKCVLSTYNDQLIITLINIIRLEPNYYKINFTPFNISNVDNFVIN
jgi:hypothetical protein